MKKLFGNTTGLKASQIKRIEKLYRSKIPPAFLVTPEIASTLTHLSYEIRRQIGILINRAGQISYVIIGDNQKIIIPYNTGEYRYGLGRLKGLRCVHTHLKNETLTRDDLTDLALLRLDMMAAITMTENGGVANIYISHILHSSYATPYEVLAPISQKELNIGCLELIRSIESELSGSGELYKAESGKERALLISVSTENREKTLDSLTELKELARSSGIHILDIIIQRRPKIDPKFLVGKGKLQDLMIICLQQEASLIVFDQELTPSQIRSITDMVETKVIDRTQLILDIFAQRAQTREGKLQVELAQLKYLLPRLITKNSAMSRLTGGIGGRGPGETKLEINRRRVRDRIINLGKELSKIQKQRKQQKAKRSKKGIPIISIVGYTNAGKSTLLNTLTKSKILAENRMFATLDPSSRRLKLPKDTEVIITDTVGFIRDLPKELMVAFRATLEELENADLLLHVVDISNSCFENQIQSVNKIIEELELSHIPIIEVLNKKDLLDNETIHRLNKFSQGIAISATNETTLLPLIDQINDFVKSLENPY